MAGRAPPRPRARGRGAAAATLGSYARYSYTVVQGLADARKRARRSGLVQFFAVYQFDRGGILQMCHTVGELCNHAVRGSMVWRQTSDTIEFCILITCCILITA